jgi:hypothetical protein
MIGEEGETNRMTHFTVGTTFQEDSHKNSSMCEVRTASSG